MCADDSISYIMLYVVGHVISNQHVLVQLYALKAAHYNIVCALKRNILKMFS